MFLFILVCGGILEGNQGTIKSPGFPGKYPKNRNCIWNIRVNRGKRVTLNIFSLQLQQSGNCEKDYLEVKLNKIMIVKKIMIMTDFL
jgi:cubilin